MKKVYRWDSLVVDTKISILVNLRVLDLPLCEIKVSRLKKQHISETEYYQILCWNLFKDDTVVSNFSDYCCSSLENENTLAIERRKHFTVAITERCSSNFCLAAIIKIILKYLWRSQIWKKIKISAFKLHFKGLHLSCKTVMLRNSFSLKHLSMATGNFVARAFQGYVCLRNTIQDITKKCSENFIECFSYKKNGMAKCVSTKNFFRRC